MSISYSESVVLVFWSLKNVRIHHTKYGQLMDNTYTYVAPGVRAKNKRQFKTDPGSGELEGCEITRGVLLLPVPYIFVDFSFLYSA